MVIVCFRDQPTFLWQLIWNADMGLIFQYELTVMLVCYQTT